MDQFPRSTYSDVDVRRAGKIIAGDVLWTDDTAPLIREAFAVANSWRDSHAFPMRSIRHSVIHHMRRIDVQGISAARLKRMKAIRAKLRRSPVELHKLQDLGGCRFILPTIADVHKLTAALKEQMPHTLRSERNYIAEPKPDGYRSQHLMYTYIGRKGRAIYDGRRIEVQVRTQLQHAWATTVEAVGLFRGEQLKNHQGSDEWLRLFELMSSEFAEAEGCPVPQSVANMAQRQREIRHLAASLDALQVLESVTHGFRGADVPLASDYNATHYLIRYDHASKTVRVEPYRMSITATRSYDIAEELDNRTGWDTQNVVLVEVDKIANLKAAYPNYFGDVGLFKTQLRLVTKGQSAVEYSIAERPTRMPDKRERIDLAWLRSSTKWRPNLGQRKGD